MNQRLIVIVTSVLGLLFGIFLALPSVNRLLGMPDLSNITEYEPISSIEVYDYKDNFVGFLQGVEDRKVIPLSEISPYLKISSSNFEYPDCLGVR